MYLAIGNPFISAYVQSDWFGKGIFLGLFALSIFSWWILLHQSWIFFHIRRLSSQFQSLFSEKDPLGLQWQRPFMSRLMEIPHPFFEVYKSLKKGTLLILTKNHASYPPMLNETLSEADLALIESQVYATAASQGKKLERQLFILSTAATLAPFLGLLGTVWGILTAFSELQQPGHSANVNGTVLSGLSLALTTTVIGLVIAIPALAGYNYLKNCVKEYRRNLEDFCHLLLTATALHYRRIDNAQTRPPVP